MANNHLLQGHFHSPHLRVRRTQSTQRLCSPLTMHPCAPTFSTGSNIPNSRTQYRAIFLSQHILQVLLIELIFPLLCKEEGQYHLLHWPGAPRGAKAGCALQLQSPFLHQQPDVGTVASTPQAGRGIWGLRGRGWGAWGLLPGPLFPLSA